MACTKLIDFEEWAEHVANLFKDEDFAISLRVDPYDVNACPNAIEIKFYHKNWPDISEFAIVHAGLRNSKKPDKTMLYMAGRVWSRINFPHGAWCGPFNYEAMKHHIAHHVILAKMSPLADSIVSNLASVELASMFDFDKFEKPVIKVEPGTFHAPWPMRTRSEWKVRFKWPSTVISINMADDWIHMEFSGDTNVSELPLLAYSMIVTNKHEVAKAIHQIASVVGQQLKRSWEKLESNVEY